MRSIRIIRLNGNVSFDKEESSRKKIKKQNFLSFKVRYSGNLAENFGPVFLPETVIYDLPTLLQQVQNVVANKESVESILIEKIECFEDGIRNSYKGRTHKTPIREYTPEEFLQLSPKFFI